MPDVGGIEDMKKLIDKIRRVYRTYRSQQSMPLRLEFIVTDYCNLNCKGCSHYSPLAPKEFVSREDLKRSMDHLGRTCRDKVEDVYLIGGETLLYPDLIEAMKNMRNAFPTQRISIFTNGLIVDKMSDEFWQTARDHDVTIAMTRYPIKYDYDAAEELIRSKGVRLKVFADRTMKDTFFKLELDPDKKQNKYKSHFKCYSRGCVSVVDGYVYPCSIAACVKHLNRAKETNFEITDRDRIRIEDIKSARQIQKLSHHPIPFCSYCVMPPKTVGYGLSKREATEWVKE
ncbi:MAG: radical SAM protein [Muribaculaceae bacterium]|nr:radical SAM protein [Muribaculaceae bacterium]